MPITIATPPSLTTRTDYAPIVAAVLENPGAWLAIDLDSLSGPTNHAKQTRVAQAARHRGLRVRTTVQGDKLYVQLIVEQETNNAR